MSPRGLHPRALRAVCAAAALTAAGPARSETLDIPLELPACQLLDLDEGTIEFDIRLDAESWLRPPDRLGGGRGRIVRFVTGDPVFPGDGLEMTLGSKPGWGTYIRAPFVSGGRNVSYMLNIGLRQPATGAWQRVAVTWSREARLLQAYVDGRPAESRAFLTGLDLNAAVGSGARLTIGPERDPARAPFELRALRISRILRPDGSLADASAPLAADGQTLLLLRRPATGDRPPQAPPEAAAATAAAGNVLRPRAGHADAQNKDQISVKRTFSP